MAVASLLPLLAWTSPAFPVGAFSYSHGLEAAVDDGLVADAAALDLWLEDLLGHGAPHNDAILAGAAWRAAAAADDDGLAALNALALALCPSRERHLEAAAQGNAFATAIRAAWPHAIVPWPPGELAYPVVFGAAAGRLGLPLGPTLQAFTHAFVGNLVSAAIRLGVIGQTDGLRITAASMGAVKALADAAERATLDDLGGAAQQSDLASLRHETLYSRLFRS